ncbi:DNA excision repair protein ERCC-6-like [Pelomyxa schiedti]|nr:DNA excision repair protein ERCC-6-like [Pelomyxa schiedti]
MAVRSLLMSGFSGAPIRSQSSTTVAVEPKSLGTVNTPHTDSLTVIPQEESTSQVPTLSQDQVNSAPQEPPQDINKVPPLSREEIRQFNLCIKKATEEKSTGELQSALLYYNKALLIRPGYQKLIHKIRSLELKVQDSKNSKSPENAMPTTEIPPVTIHERDIEESANSNVSDNLQNEHLPHSLETDTVHFGNEHTSNKTVSNVDHPNAQVPLSEEQLLEQLFPEEFQFSINSKPVSYNIQVAEPCPLTTREELQEVPSFSVKPTSELVSGTAAISSDSDEHIPEQNVIEPVPGCSFVHDLSSKTYKLGDVFSVPPRIFEVLFSYQKRGVEWLWSIHNLEPPGGCLGDDMGLGKTLQLIAFLSGLFLNKLIKQALIVCPLSVINHWVSELHKWAPQISVGIFHGSNPAQRLKEFKRVQKMTGICLTTYGMLLTQQEELCSVTWDYVILDEGHKIKNSKTQISKVARQIPSTRRILVSGTPIMNNLQELWSLMDWVCQGKLLGTLKEFRRTYEDPIVQGNDKHATELAKGVGSKLAESLRKLIHPYVLRREKKDVLQAPPSPYHLPEPPSSSEKMIEKATSSPSKSSLNQSGKVTVSPGTTKLRRRSVILTARKNDFIIWVKMSDQQVRLYKEFLGTDEITAVLSRSRSPLAALTVLKKICDSPNLLHEEMVTTSTLDLRPVKELQEV